MCGSRRTGRSESVSERERAADHPYRRSEAFFGRRKTRGLSDRKTGLSQTLLPKLLVDVTQPVADPFTLFDRDVRAVHIEIGFGGGEHLLHRAKDELDVGFIGVEPFVNGMAQLLAHADGRDLSNLRLYDEDAVELLDALPAKCAERVDLLYPDPWPKRKHWKRRFIGDRNVKRIARVLRTDGEFRFASDIRSYVDWTLHHTQRHGGLEWTARTVGDWSEPWDGWIRTRYEAKAVREGREPCYLRFRRSG